MLCVTRIFSALREADNEPIPLESADLNTLPTVQLVALVFDVFLVPRIQGMSANGVTLAVDFEQRYGMLAEGSSPMGDHMVTILGIFVAILLFAVLVGWRVLPGRGGSGGGSSY